MRIEDVTIGNYVYKSPHKTKLLISDTNLNNKISFNENAVAFLVPKKYGWNYGIRHAEYEKKLPTSMLLQYDVRWLHCLFLEKNLVVND